MEQAESAIKGRASKLWIEVGAVKGSSKLMLNQRPLWECEEGLCRGPGNKGSVCYKESYWAECSRAALGNRALDVATS